jgi:FtsP/CotA-like multicopper oxidase with cupredoxin domain
MIKTRFYCCSFLLMSLFQHVLANVVPQTLYINRGTFTTVSATTFTCMAYNNGPVYNSLNEVLNLSTSDTLTLTIVNNDTITHGFDVWNYSGVTQTILPGDSVTVPLHFSSESIWIYYDQLNYPDLRYMGLGGMICVTNSTQQKFYWNIKEHQTSHNNQIALGIPVNWNAYYPDYFTINGKSFPDLQNDTTAVPLVNVGDTIFIFIANTGQSKHSIHFHGFHALAQYAYNPIQTNWSKDTWPLKSMDAYILRVVFDKLGRYSVHDHNLVAVSGGGIHPNGMFLIMESQ